MATDQTPTRDNVMLIIAAVTVATLIGAHFVFRAYHVVQRQQKIDEMVLEVDKPAGERRVGRERREYARRDAERLSAGSMPLAAAMERLAASERSEVEHVAPKPSDDMAALDGWSFAHEPTAELAKTISMGSVTAHGGVTQESQSSDEAESRSGAVQGGGAGNGTVAAPVERPRAPPQRRAPAQPQQDAPRATPRGKAAKQPEQNAAQQKAESQETGENGALADQPKGPTPEAGKMGAESAE